MTVGVRAVSKKPSATHMDRNVYMVDFDERAETIRAASLNYISGEWSRTRCEPVLRACGMNATEVDDFFSEHREAASAAFAERNKGRSNDNSRKD